jgi:(4S)-4-hydroxy-5-phosphonooxypentane-2,3-dione isomerase
VSFVVTVVFEAKPAFHETFREAIVANAQASRACEPGCRRFDVCESADGSRIFLYEVYDDEAAFQAHLATDHYLHFSERATPWVAEKRVATYNLLYPET